jgi:hypothetical protein
MAATPRPWRRVEPVAIDYRATLIYDSENEALIAQMCGGGRVRAIGVAEERANAALIVKAVNCHEELVAALKKIAALDQNSGSSLRARVSSEIARTALAKVGAP